MILIILIKQYCGSTAIFYNSINLSLSIRIELTPKDLQKSVGVISLLSAY